MHLITLCGLYNWLIDWLIDWSIGWLIDWLIEWLILFSALTYIVNFCCQDPQGQHGAGKALWLLHERAFILFARLPILHTFRRETNGQRVPWSLSLSSSCSRRGGKKKNLENDFDNCSSYWCLTLTPKVLYFTPITRPQSATKSVETPVALILGTSCHLTPRIKD